jgi:hypothetical protein
MSVAPMPSNRPTSSSLGPPGRRSGWIRFFTVFGAYVDESHYAEPPGFYLLAAALFAGPAAAAARATMQELTRALRVNRVHWHDLDAKRRDIALAGVTRLSFTAVAVVGSPMAARQERARRQCLGRLLWETGDVGPRWRCSSRAAPTRSS